MLREVVVKAVVVLLVPHHQLQVRCASTDEVLSQVRSHLHRNSEYTRGDSPEPDDLDEYRYLDPSRCGSPTNEDDIVTASEGQAQFRGRKYRDGSCVCTGVKGPNGVFTSVSI